MKSTKQQSYAKKRKRKMNPDRDFSANTIFPTNNFWIKILYTKVVTYHKKSQQFLLGDSTRTTLRVRLFATRPPFLSQTWACSKYIRLMHVSSIKETAYSSFLFLIETWWGNKRSCIWCVKGYYHIFFCLNAS
jgi:hypothetical protein